MKQDRGSAAIQRPTIISLPVRLYRNSDECRGSTSPKDTFKAYLQEKCNNICIGVEQTQFISYKVKLTCNFGESRA